MITYRRFMLLLSQDKRSLFLLLEATVLMGWVRYKLLYRPFSDLALKLGLSMCETSYHPVDKNRKMLFEVHRAVSIMSKYTFWESKCLVQAVSAMKMLERRGIESTLYLGTAKNDKGKMIAHAWLRSGSSYITGGEEMSKFTVTGSFAITELNSEARKVMRR